MKKILFSIWSWCGQNNNDYCKLAFYSSVTYHIKKNIVMVIKTATMEVEDDEYGNIGISLDFEVLWMRFHNFYSNSACICICMRVCWNFVTFSGPQRAFCVLLWWYQYVVWMCMSGENSAQTMLSIEILFAEYLTKC